MDWRGLVEAVVGDLRGGRAPAVVAARFHNAMVEMVRRVARELGAPRVALSGGCFQNRRLTEGCVDGLRRDGFEVLRAMRAERRLSRIPVVILSMKDREEDIVRCLEEGADDYVVKPFNARELVVRIRKQLQRARGRN